MNTLSLCMIVKNEESWIETAIVSVKSIVDEIIVVDTGSTDLTKPKALALGAKVYDYQWCDDFSAARNYSLAQATCDWILVLDADETIDDTGCNLIKEYLLNPGENLVFLNQLTYTFESHSILWKRNDQKVDYVTKFPGYILSPLIRLFRNIADIRYEGCVHEHPVCKMNIPSVTLPVSIHHFSLVRRDIKQNKRDMYLKLGKHKLELEPDNLKVIMEYAIALGEMNKFSEGVLVLEKIYEQNKSNINYMILIAGFYQACSQNEKFEQTLRKLNEINPTHPNVILMSIDRLIQQKEYIQASQLLNVHISGMLHWEEFHKRLIRLHLMMGQREVAVECFQNSLRYIHNSLYEQQMQYEMSRCI